MPLVNDSISALFPPTQSTPTESREGLLSTRSHSDEENNGDTLNQGKKELSETKTVDSERPQQQQRKDKAMVAESKTKPQQRPKNLVPCRVCLLDGTDYVVDVEVRLNLKSLFGV